MIVDIYIREKSGNREIRIPLLPEEFDFSKGDTMFVTADILGRGEVAVPSGIEMGSYSWKSEFPGPLRKNDAMMRGKWQDPKTYRSILEDWKRDGTKLNLLITGYPINVDVYCEEFSSTGTGPFGDINYEISFIEARDITIKYDRPSTGITVRSKSTGKTYTIKEGDTLWTIAENVYGSGGQWEKIYLANKDIIESTAKKFRESSQYGHYIYPGVTLTLP